MNKRLLRAALAAALLASLLGVFSLTATAQQRTFLVRMKTGTVIKVTVDAPAGVPMSQVPGLPGTAIGEITQSAPPPVGNGGKGGGGNGGGGGSNNGGGGGGGPSASHPGHPSSHGGHPQPHSGSQTHAPKPRGQGKTRGHGSGRGTPTTKPTNLRNPDGSPNPHNPTFFDALPSPGGISAVPNFVIRQFDVQIFLLHIYL
ncbi:MAG: hypothetical protein QOK25_724, partial [Thermoleophilaceae bacterium]|nr:hypothetical protein [Thermoleophilaceae bacterium]